MAARILFAEDEQHIAQTVVLNLELEGYKVVHTANGKDAIKEFRNARFDLVILDVMLPEVSGFEICETIRLENKKVPILFLTAKGSSEEKVRGLKLGADDYITKPFHLEEFLLRVQALLKRGVEQQEPAASLAGLFNFGKCEINFDNFEAKGVSGEVKQFSKKEMMLLKLLIERKNEVVSREKIQEYVWGYDVFSSTRSIDNFILGFRKFFEPDPKEPRYFHSVRGVGYKFTA